MSKKVPQIRFNGYSDSWEERKLKDVSTYIRGSFPQPYTNPDFYDEKNGKPFVQVADIGYDLKLKPDTKSHISKLAESKSRFVEAGKVVVALQGSIETSIGRTAITQYDAFFDRTILIFQEYKVPIDKQYFSQIIKKLFEREKEHAWGATISTITKEHLNDFIVGVPSIEEQQKIGTFFKQLDDTIALHQRKLDLLKEQKKGYLQKMFPKNGEKVPELRFAGFADDWDERKLGDITTWTKGQGLSKEYLNNERYGSEAVHYADLYKFSPVMQEVIHWTNSDDGRIIPDNSLLFPASDVTPVGLARTSTLRLSGVKAGGDVIIGQLSERINSSFMSYQINANSKKILPLITGTTVKHVQAKSLATMSVTITNMAEQTAIAGLFERIDNLIALHQRKLDFLKEQKKGLLQKMFV